MWGAARAAVDSNTGHLLARLGDHAEAEHHHARAARYYASTDHQRITALSLAAEGHAQYAQGHIEHACTTWHRALDTMTGIHSQRTRQAAAAMRTGLNQPRHQHTHTAHNLNHRLRTWLHDGS